MLTKRMKVCPTKVLILAIICLSIFPVSSENNPPREIIIATDDFPPFRMLDTAPPSGIDYDVMAEIAERLNLKPVYRRYPWARCLQMMEDGAVDAMFLAKRPDREVYTTYTNPPYFIINVAFYIKKGNGYVIDEYEDLYNYNIGFVRGSAYMPRFDNDTLLKKYPVIKEEQLIEMLILDRIDVFIGTDTQADFHINKLEHMEEIEKAEYYAGTNEVYFGISKRSVYAEEVENFNKVISDLLAEGVIDEILEKYR